MKNFFEKLENKNNKEIISQFVKFGAVGVSNTLISTLIYYAFIYVNTNLYFIGSAVGWVVSVFNSFYLNDKFVFIKEDKSFRAKMNRLLKSYVSYGGTFILTQCLLVLEVDVLMLSAWIAPIINLFITIPLNFILNKFFTFKK